MKGAVLGVLIEWLTTGRFPREEFAVSWRRVGVLFAVSGAAFTIFMVLIVVGVELGLIGDT